MANPVAEGKETWLWGYASNQYDWHIQQNGSRKTLWRRMGMVEGLFDTDGTDFEGRADLGINLHVEVKTSLHADALREQIALAWALLREQHILLSARALQVKDVDTSEPRPEDRIFVLDPGSTVAEILPRAENHLTFLGDHYSHINTRNFYEHLMNASRAIQSTSTLSRLFVLPFEHSRTRAFQIHFICVAAHQIVDGLTSFRWMSSFIDLLNRDTAQLRQRAQELLAANIFDRLPPAQESLYPPIRGNKARQRWFWAITRVLRHVHRPPPASFQNPLRRLRKLAHSVTYPSTYSAALDYSRTPPLNSGVITPVLSSKATERLAKMSRSANISIGSGLFTLVGMVMMQFEEELHPDVAPEDRLPFVGSFPVNPRPFLAGAPTTGREDSLMLAFSDGIVLPFLTTDLDFEARFRLLGRQAHRQLRQYQKRRRTQEEEIRMGIKAPNQLLASLYVATADRLEARRRPENRAGWVIQGEYPAAVSPSLSTCGVSSVGDRTSLISSGKYDTSKLPEGKDKVVDFRHIQSAVRPRDGEFLSGCAADQNHLYFGVSYDSCAIDPQKAEQFKTMIETILEPAGVLEARL